MGVSIEVYRCQIGIFNLNWRPPLKTKSPCGKSEIGFSFRLIPILVLLALLLISGIEPNPGPVFACPNCKSSFSSISNYAQHVKVHQSLKRKQLSKNTIPCCFGCDTSFSNIPSFASHISRYHKEKGNKRQVEQLAVINVEGKVVRCPIASCQCAITTRPQYLEHMVEHLRIGLSFMCPLCISTKKPFDNVFKFRVHTARYHPDDHRAFDPAPIDVICSRPCMFVGSPLLQEGPVVADSDAEDDPLLLATEGEVMNSDQEDASSIAQPDFFEKDDLYPEHLIKDELARFYLKLEGEFVLPTTQVQAISEEVKLVTELIHHRLKKALMKELTEAGIIDVVRESVAAKTFKQDPVFNIHHKHEDVEQLGTHHMRQKYWHKRFPYTAPKQIRVGTSDVGKARNAHYLSIRETMQLLFRDKKLNNLLEQSFDRDCASNVLSDYYHGSAYAQHRTQHPDGRCFQLLLFQDEFDFNAYSASGGLYKPNGFYYSLGNLPAEYRSKVDLIQLAYMILAKDMKATAQEELLDHDKLKAVLKPLIDELIDLKINGINFNGEIIPVCLLFLIGDSLGQHQIGGYVRNFSSEYTCRFCPMSKTDFKTRPFDVMPLRTREEYDQAVDIAKRRWRTNRRALLRMTAKKVKRLGNQRLRGMLAKCSGPQMRSVLKKSVSKNAFKKLCAVSYRGVKYRPSPFNLEALNFHVSTPAQPVCLSHDLFEGTLKVVLAQILKYFIEVKEYFDLETLNRRIKNFKCQGSDARDAPLPLKTLAKLNGNACEIWNLCRLLPLMIGDLIQDEDDTYWQLYLLMKQIVEWVCAPKITLEQVTYLRVLIRSYLNMIKKLLPDTLIPKHHFLCHYPDLILIFGPLIRLSTLRFESKHMFFKEVVRACKSYINITLTMARKYMSRFAYDHSSEIIPPDVLYDSSKARPVDLADFNETQIAALPENVDYENVESVSAVTLKSVDYCKGQVLILDRESAQDLKAGRISDILIQDQTKVLFLFEETTAINTLNGYYILQSPAPTKSYCVRTIEDLPDYYPLPVYKFQQKECIVLKHAVVCMMLLPHIFWNLCAADDLKSE